MVKILVSGPVKGEFSTLFDKVGKLNAGKVGPFDMLFCVGPFTSDDSDTDKQTELKRYTENKTESRNSGESISPIIPTYFYDSGESNHFKALLKEHETEVQEISKDLYYLGSGGIKTIGKLTVAFYSESSTSTDLEKCRKIGKMGGYGGADLLLTSTWPKGFDSTLPESSFIQLETMGVLSAAVGSKVAADLALVTVPRYHFSSGEGIYYQRLPYKNKGEEADENKNKKALHVTRFIGLGDCDLDAKNKLKKWLHAINLEPLAYMKKDVLSEEPKGSTENPYIEETGTKRHSESYLEKKEKKQKQNFSEEVDNTLQSTRFVPTWAMKNNSAQEVSHRWEKSKAHARKNSLDSDPNNCSVFVGSMFYKNVSKDELMQKFETVGKVSCVKIVSESVFGFVDFEKRADAEKAIEVFNGLNFKGNSLSVGWASSANENRSHSLDSSNSTVYVGNLPKREFDENELIGAFLDLGFSSSDIVSFKNCFKGFGFVRFSNHELASEAISKGGGCLNLFGHPLTLSWSTGRSAQNQNSTDDVKECWFCLASGKFLEHLVVNVGEEVYLTLPKGSLVPFHCLVVPIAHARSYSELTAEAIDEIDARKKSLKAFFEAYNFEFFCFERCVDTKGTNHMHIQAVPIPFGEAARGARMLLKTEGMRWNISFEELDKSADLKKELSETEYFYAEVPGETKGDTNRYICRGNSSQLPMQFGRDVAARLLLMPERAQWKACKNDETEEIELTKDFRAKYAPFETK